ncbi:MAG TPA: hypothetical protein VGH85_17215 [Mycobacteriales bacterium]
MKAVLLTVAVGLASMVMATPSGIASHGCRARPVSQHTARLTIKFLHIVDKPIHTRACDLAYGPIWDVGYATRAGMGLTMVIDAHDVTPVPGYGAHGPFYRLYLIKPGYLAKIKWNGVWRTYRFVSSPRPYPQRPKSEVDKPIKNFGVEVVYFRCCWPRYTRNAYLTVRAVLVKPKE